MLAQLKKLLFGSGVDFKAMLEQGAVILDVRSPQEYATGHLDGAINVPLQQLEQHIGKMKQAGKPVITCCASGIRSANAASQLRNAGVEAVNGGGWHRLAGKLR